MKNSILTINTVLLTFLTIGVLLMIAFLPWSVLLSNTYYFVLLPVVIIVMGLPYTLPIIRAGSWKKQRFGRKLYLLSPLLNVAVILMYIMFYWILSAT